MSVDLSQVIWLRCCQWSCCNSLGCKLAWDSANTFSIMLVYRYTKMLLIKCCIYALYIYTFLEKYHCQPHHDDDRYCDLLMGSSGVTRAGKTKTMGDFSCIPILILMDQVHNSIRSGNEISTVPTARPHLEVCQKLLQGADPQETHERQVALE